MTVHYEHNIEHVILMPKLSGKDVKTIKREILRLNDIFKSFDEDNDGYLKKAEIENLINCNPDEFDDVNNAISKVTDNMNFEQFLELVDNVVISEDNDKVEEFTEYIESNNNSDIEFKSKGFTFYVPVILVISIIQIICFMYNLIQMNIDINEITTEGNIFFNEDLNLMDSNWAKQFKVGIHTDGFYRYFTYQFVHGSCNHLVMNILIQLLLGIPLEFMHGSWRLIVVYLAGVLSGSVGHVNFQTSFLCGASGGVYAMITANIATVLMNWKAMHCVFLRLLVLMSFIVADVYIKYKDHHIQNEVLVCQSIAGFLVGIGILHNFKSNGFKRVLWISCITIYCLLMTYGILMIGCIQRSENNLKDEEKTKICYKVSHYLFD